MKQKGTMSKKNYIEGKQDNLNGGEEICEYDDVESEKYEHFCGYCHCRREKLLCHIMFAQQIFQDFKENLKSTVPAKTSGISRKGLASRSLNSFPDSSNVIKSKKNTLDEKSCHFFSEKSDVKPKINLQEKKVDLHSVDEAWSDIEEMHICDEPEDDYEDILPKCERIQQADIDALFVNYTFTNYAELTADKLPSPLKEVEGFDFPEFSPPLPDFKASLFDDSELDFIPLSNNLCLL